MAIFREAKREFPPQPSVKSVAVDASTRFVATSRDFVISPLKNTTKLYIESIFEGVKDSAPLQDLNADEYTQINGAIRGSVLYVDTDETFYVKFN